MHFSFMRFSPVYVFLQKIFVEMDIVDRTNKFIQVTDADPLFLCVCPELFLDPRKSFGEPFLFAFLTCKVGAGEDQCNKETVLGISRELFTLRLFCLTQ